VSDQHEGAAGDGHRQHRPQKRAPINGVAFEVAQLDWTGICVSITQGVPSFAAIPSIETRSGRSAHCVKVKNPKAPAVTREAEEDWG
jgi:hypothetical protein